MLMLRTGLGAPTTVQPAGSANIAPVEALKQLATAFALLIFQREYQDWMVSGLVTLLSTAADMAGMPV